MERKDQGSQKDMFLKLLVAQMKYQDPANPASSSEFMAQTATFTQVEKLEEIAAQNASLLALQRSSSAGALVGRTVSYTDDDRRDEDRHGHLRPARQPTQTEAAAVVGGVTVPMGRITEVSTSRLTPPTRLPAARDPTPEEFLPMLRSMFSAISGLRAHQTKMDVTGNNIANVNTVGFKGSQTVFQDTLSQVIRAGGAPAAGPRRHQPGAGRPRRQGRRDHHQLDPGRHPVHRPLHRLHDRGRRLLRHPRRAPSSSTPAPGSFDFDGAGKLVTPDGSILQGWMADANGVVNPNGPIGDLSVPYGQIVAPAADHDRQRRRATCPPDAADRRRRADRHHHVRRQGVAQEVFYNFTKMTAANDWTLDVDHADGTTLVTGAAGRRSTPPAR